MDRLFIISFLFLALFAEQAFSQDFVLVTSSEVEYETFSNLELRKVFLGYSLRKNDRPVLAVINSAQRNSYNRFLQMVVSMSETRFEKQLLAQSFRQGSSRPELLDDMIAIKKSLIEKPGSISFMWKEDVEQSPNLKVIQVLWSSSD